MAEEEIKKTEAEGETPHAGHGDFPFYLVIIFIFIGIWAAFSWIPFFGY